MLLLLSVSASFGQAVTETITEAAAADITKTAKCTPSPECAAKMGMTLEECKKLCSKATAECKAKCLKSGDAESATDGDVKVAAASFESEIADINSADVEVAKVESPAKEKVCAKGSKACCKKKGE